jgi:arylsulfatase A-like enzyme
MNRRVIFRLSILGAFSFFLSASSGAEDAQQCQPNLIYINADDLGWADTTYQGSTFYKTPNIDRLASQGITFPNAYAPAANCAPSRASCMSGQYTPRHGIYTVGRSDRGNTKDRKLIPTKNNTVLADTHITIAEVLKASGYVTCHVGKWHLGPDPETQGFDINIAGCQWGAPSGGGYHSPYKYPNCEQKQKGEYLTDRLGSEAVKFITENKDRPFFLHFATHSVHTPLQGKADLIAKYENEPPSNAHMNPTYAAMIHSLDENVGRIMAKIDDLGLAKNTLILFSSDNGGVWKFSKQWPLRAGKGTYYEGGIRAPLVVRWTGKITPGTTCDIPVNGIDFFPTFLEAASAATPEGIQLDGVSLIPLLTQTGMTKKRPLFWHFPVYLPEGNPETRDPKFRTRPGSVVRYGDWKLHEYFEDGGLELYNLKHDIGETNNLAGTEPEKVKELYHMLKAWRMQKGAPVPSETNPMYKP